MPETTCAYCKGTIADGATKCQHCGEFIDQGEAQRRRDKEIGRWAYAALFLVGLFMMVGMCSTVRM